MKRKGTFPTVEKVNTYDFILLTNEKFIIYKQKKQAQVPL